MAKPVADPRGSARLQPTMADVAEHAGVSTMTVSRAFRAGSAISNDTRQRIMAAVEELGYVLDQTAGTLSSRRSGFIAVLVPSLNNSNFSDTARGIAEAVEQSGLQMLLGYTDYMVEKEESLVEAMLRRRPEGIIVTGGRHTERTRRLLLCAAIPVVETWDLPAEPIEHVVGFSNAEATRRLVCELHARGYRRIGFIGGSTNRDTRGADRRHGYECAVAEFGLPHSRVISFGKPPISMEQGGHAMELLVSQWPDVEAAVCVSDLSAFGAIMECQRRGWAVPGRIGVAGFGDFEVSRCTYPSITTVAVDSFAIGFAAGEILLRAIQGRRDNVPVAPETLLTPFRVMLRGSTR
jgi:LacI family transcriptional regulator, gluconate utilization system Gnt-I transcriptional repressor